MNVLDIFTSILKPIGDYFNRRQEIKAAEHQTEIKIIEAQGERQAQLAKEGLAADAAWEMEFARQAATSWKDDFELLVITIPLISMFFWPDATKAGFKAIEDMPGWYIGLVIMIYSANYGIRQWRRTISDT